jgi:hypothetical protein
MMVASKPCLFVRRKPSFLQDAVSLRVPPLLPECRSKKSTRQRARERERKCVTPGRNQTRQEPDIVSPSPILNRQESDQASSLFPFPAPPPDPPPTLSFHLLLPTLVSKCGVLERSWLTSEMDLTIFVR